MPIFPFFNLNCQLFHNFSYFLQPGSIQKRQNPSHHIEITFLRLFAVSYKFLSKKLSNQHRLVMSLCYLTIFPLFISTFFLQQDPDDLPFKKGETLTIISKDEEQWWTARNSLGQTGSVPVPYITVVRKLKTI